MHNITQVLEAKKYISEKIDIKPKIGLILGSGLGSLADEFAAKVIIPYHEIPYFAKSEAIGHANELIIGKISGKPVIAMKGRFHYYEGYSLDEVTFPIRVLKALGVEYVIITNSCGAVNLEYKPGELMLITDHLNLVGINPLIGKNDQRLGTRFPDLSNVYDSDLRKLVIKIAEANEIAIHQGIYAWWSGPAYETPAEIKMIRTLGADAVGMSTVPEAIVASHANMKVIAISCLTNMASGILKKPLSHEDVIAVANQAKERFISLVYGIIKSLSTI
jgi:purine-nucleoside phosphorylase